MKALDGKNSCTISASYEVSQAQKSFAHAAYSQSASTSSDELNAQVSLPTDDE